MIKLNNAIIIPCLERKCLSITPVLFSPKKSSAGRICKTRAVAGGTTRYAPINVKPGKGDGGGCKGRRFDKIFLPPEWGN